VRQHVRGHLAQVARLLGDPDGLGRDAERELGKLAPFQQERERTCLAETRGGIADVLEVRDGAREVHLGGSAVAGIERGDGLVGGGRDARGGRVRHDGPPFGSASLHLSPYAGMAARP
jgi:hypothetical protein